ncbi:MAG: exosortase A [Betaproteobacteria bacterium HGW-Betaproteobacteria-10]|nr:MAG: exosortase A [Betaproteobacteria bacterium HGW-Betaproteobacteria-10]
MTTTVAPITPAWRQAIALLLGLLGWIGFWYWETAVAMVDIWSRSDTYAHAFIVPPITLWLIWRQRAQVLAEQPRTSFLLAIPVACTTFLWLLGELTAVNALTQFALVATLVLAIMALLGTSVSKRIAFPLAFLFFSIPFGDFMLPKLMEWTATFTVLALRSSGIPVYQEGLQFIIPTGSWSVIEACSGIRYIIASVTVGTLFAYLNYVSLRRRLIFIAVAIIVPVIANWLRAYMIVMLGHLSGNKLAAGVDHLIYGWVFFGIVIMVMFAIGARWSQDAPATTALPGAMQAPGKKQNAWLAALAIALLAAAGPLGFIAIDKADQANEPHLALFTPSAEWQESAAFASWKPAYANPSAELQTTYRQQEKTVGLYIAYYRNQDYQRKLVTSGNSLATSTDHIWSVTAQSQTPASQANLPAQLRTAQLLGKDTSPETRLLVWQWYWINGKLTTSDIEAKLFTALSRLRGQGDDSATVILYTPFEQTDNPQTTLQAFAAVNAENITKILQQTRDQR